MFSRSPSLFFTVVVFSLRCRGYCFSLALIDPLILPGSSSSLRTTVAPFIDRGTCRQQGDNVFTMMVPSSSRSIRRRSERLIRQSLALPQLPSVTSLSSKASSSSESDIALTMPTPGAPASVTPSPKKEGTKTTATTRRKRKSPSQAVRSLDLTVEKAMKTTTTTTTTKKATTIPSSPLLPNSEVSGNDDGIVLTSDLIATINPSQEFVDLVVPPDELRPSTTLTTGQCFHWKVVHPSRSSATTVGSNVTTTTTTTSAWGTHNATEWVGTLRLANYRMSISCSNSSNNNDDAYIESIVLVIRETPTSTLFRPLTTSSLSVLEIRNALRTYFRLDEISLPPLYEEWSANCPRLAQIANCIRGVRIVDQDPWECLVSFICSSNNNIPRITKMLSRLRKEYGHPLPLVLSSSPSGGDRNDDNGIVRSLMAEPLFYSFPSLDDLLSKSTEDDLRTNCGMGYRAKYITETMRLLKDKGGERYLHEELRMSTNNINNKDTTKGDDDDGNNSNDADYVQSKLCEFHGVGRKVADCVALFSLRQDDAIPVDTHVWNIARRDYDNSDDGDRIGEGRGNLDRNMDQQEGQSSSSSSSLSSTSSLTPTVYRRVGDLFRKRFPNRPGWAHSLLFVAELPSFRTVLPVSVIEEMDDFRKKEQQRKKDIQVEKKQKTTSTKKRK